MSNDVTDRNKEKRKMMIASVLQQAVYKSTTGELISTRNIGDFEAGEVLFDQSGYVSPSFEHDSIISYEIGDPNNPFFPWLKHRFITNNLARFEETRCPNCGSNQVYYNGKDYSVKQGYVKKRLKCQFCGRNYRIHNSTLGMGPKMKNPRPIISYALDLLERHKSTRQIAKAIQERFGCHIVHSTVYHWCHKYRPRLKLEKGKPHDLEWKSKISQGVIKHNLLTKENKNSRQKSTMFNISPDIIQYALYSVKKHSYRVTALLIQEKFNTNISHQMVRNWVRMRRK